MDRLKALILFTILSAASVFLVMSALGRKNEQIREQLLRLDSLEAAMDTTIMTLEDSTSVYTRRLVQLERMLQDAMVRTEVVIKPDTIIREVPVSADSTKRFYSAYIDHERVRGVVTIDTQDLFAQWKLVLEPIPLRVIVRCRDGSGSVQRALVEVRVPRGVRLDISEPTVDADVCSPRPASGSRWYLWLAGGVVGGLLLR